MAQKIREHGWKGRISTKQQGVRRERLQVKKGGEEGKREGKKQTLRRHYKVKTSRDEGKGRGNEQGVIGHYRG